MERGCAWALHVLLMHSFGVWARGGAAYAGAHALPDNGLVLWLL